MFAWGTLLHAYLTTRYGRRFRTREALESWQERRVRRLLANILPRSPFYREWMGGVASEEWRQVPVIDKAIMMEHFDRLNTAGIAREEAFALAFRAEETRDFTPSINRVTIGLSSGTSGNRGLFLVSPAERMMWAGTILAKALPEPLWISQRVAFFLRANSNLYATVKSRRIQFQFFDLLDSLEQHMARLNRYQPTILVAPPSMLRLLARAQADGTISLKGIKKLISVAEVLDPLDERYIRSQFEQPVHQIYQCTEGFLASTCEHGTLHLNEDLLVVEKEYLDFDQGKFVPILTDFCRTTQPIIRYRLNDILTERQTPCPCGAVTTALQTIEGRCDDLFYLPSARDGRLVPVFPDFLRRAVMTASPAIEEYRVIQLGPDQVEIMLKCENDAEAEIERQVRDRLTQLRKEMGLGDMNLTFSSYQAPARGVKLRRVERRWSVDV